MALGSLFQIFRPKDRIFFFHFEASAANVLRMSEDLLAIITANSRGPVEVRGDLLSLVSCNDVGGERLLAMMAEFGLESIDALAAHILEKSRRATLEAIARVPAGVYRSESTFEPSSCARRVPWTSWKRTLSPLWQ